MTKTDIERIVDERLAEMRKQMIEELQEQVESNHDSKTIWDLSVGDKAEYYRLYSDGDVAKLSFDSYYDEKSREAGNAFLTKEEAELELERRKIEAIMKKYSSPFVDGKINYFLEYNHESEAIDVDYYCTVNNSIPYFESEDIAKKVINEIGGDRLKKYWFRVKDDE